MDKSNNVTGFTENNAFNTFLIQPIRSILPHFGDHTEGKEAIALQAKQEWWDISDALMVIIRKAVNKLCAKGAMDTERRHDFFKSGFQRYIFIRKIGHIFQYRYVIEFIYMSLCPLNSFMFFLCRKRCTLKLWLMNFK